MNTDVIKKIFKKGIFEYVGLLSAVMAIVLVIVGATTKGFADRTFDGAVIALLIVGAVVAIAGFVLNFRFVPLVAAIFFAIAYGLICYDGAPILADYFNDLNWNNGDSGAVLAYLIIGAICCIASVVTCFSNSKLEK
jgi:hypothetical protein